MDHQQDAQVLFGVVPEARLIEFKIDEPLPRDDRNPLKWALIYSTLIA